MTYVIVQTSSTSVDSGIVDITIIDQIQNNIDIISKSVEIGIVDIGFQGLPGAQGIQGHKGDIGDPLEFQALTEEQKIELRGDVGNTSTNYTNLFNSVLLS